MKHKLPIDDLGILHALSEISGLGPVKIKNLVNEFSRPANIRLANLTQIAGVRGITKKISEQIIESMNNIENSLKFIEEQLVLADRHHGKIISILDEEYPRNLKESAACHGLIYAIGNTEKLNRLSKQAIAIVGTRKASDSGLRKSYEFAKELARAGYCIVSGLAEGIDSQAHKGGLDGGGFTIAVVGCGPDIVYPKSSEDFRPMLIKNGAIISEFPFGTNIDRLRLMKRNKTLVGLSNWLLVVETGKKGGTFNSIRAAREQQKRIFVDIPDNPSLKSVHGNLDLIRSIVAVKGPSQILHEIQEEEKYEQETIF